MEHLKRSYMGGKKGKDTLKVWKTYKKASLDIIGNFLKACPLLN